ncbi:MAG: hypothetical protein LBV43_13340 [Prevotella sp.]|jgi:membrane protease YdiL (CAAX protease family)|nr:hypothetical protein [Prevotella sp.]
MSLTEQTKKIRNTTLLLFWTSIILSVAALIVLFLNRGIDWQETSDVTFQQFSIIVTLGGIPLALKLFHSRYKKLEGLDYESFLKKYFNIYILRLGILDVVILFNLAGLYLFNSQNAVYMTIITIFAIFFCYPNKGDMEDKNETNNNSDNEQNNTNI